MQLQYAHVLTVVQVVSFENFSVQLRTFQSTHVQIHFYCWVIVYPNIFRQLQLCPPILVNLGAPIRKVHKTSIENHQTNSAKRPNRPPTHSTSSC